MNKSYASNFALETGNDNFIFITPHSLDHKFIDRPDDIIEKCHIYCVVDYPRVNFVPDSIIYEILNNEIIYRVLLEYRHNGEMKRVAIEDRVPLSGNISKVIIDKYPHTEIILLDSNDNFVMSTTALKLAYAASIPDLTNLNVLYIGKGTGIKKQKNALERVQEHKTIQKILAFHHARHPDRSVLIGLFNFGAVNKYAFIDGMDHSKIFGLDDFTRLMHAQQFQLSLNQKTAIIEAALIRYFEPEYNDKLKKDLPAKNSKALADCYKYDISAIVVKLWTSDENSPYLNYYLYSHKVESSEKHNICIELIDPEVRKGFFSIGGYNYAPEGTIRRNKRK